MSTSANAARPDLGALRIDKDKRQERKTGKIFGIILAAILFGILYQGGAELAFEKPKISRDMIVVIQGLVVLFAGALEHMFRRPVAVLLARRTTSPPI